MKLFVRILGPSHAHDFPLLLAAAPLKPERPHVAVTVTAGFSAAFSGGPIEAGEVAKGETSTR